MVFGGGGKFHVTGGVQRSLNGVLNNANDEANADDLHGNIIGNAKQRAGHGDEQQRTARNTGSAACAQSRHDGQQDGGRHGDLHAQRVGGSQRHDGDGNGSAVHIDGCAQRDGDGVNILIQAQLFAQRHVDRDVGGGAAGEESGQAAFTQAAEHQWVGVAVQVDKDDERVDHQRHQQHGAHQQQQQAPVLGKDGQAVVRHVGKHQAHNAKRRQVDDPPHNGRNCIRRVGHKVLGGIAAQLFHGKAEQAGPHQDADIVAVHDGSNRVRNNVGKQGVHHITQALGHHIRRGSFRQNQRLREQLAGHNAERSRHKGGEHVQPDHRTKAAVQLGGALRQCTGNNNKHQHRCNAFQRADKQVAEFFDPCSTGADQSQHRTDHQADCNAQDQAGGVVLGSQRFGRFCELIHNDSSSLF